MSFRFKKLWTDYEHYVLLRSKAKRVFAQSQLDCGTERELLVL